MRLVTFMNSAGPRPGALRGDDVVDLSPVTQSIVDLVEAGPDALERVRAYAESAEAAVAFADARLMAPIPRPRNHLYCIGWNYPKHYDEGVGKRAGQETEARERPTFFSKPPGTVIGPDAPVSYDATITERLDYEGELALVIGREGRSIARDAVPGHVFGYTLANDISARDIQRRHGGQWLKGKGMDTYCPLGPVLVTADEVPDPGAMRLTCSVNGELRQEALIASMIFPIDVMISELSLGMTLFPGDIVLTGTPPGVGFARDPQVFLRPGDSVEVAIEEIGEIANPIVDQALT